MSVKSTERLYEIHALVGGTEAGPKFAASLRRVNKTIAFMVCELRCCVVAAVVRC